MNAHQEGWFSEISDFWPGVALSLKVEKVLYEKKSDYQDVMVVQTETYGRALILDGLIQCTEKDEFSYQERVAFLPLCSHPNPENVLIIGGGDDGVAYEVAKHPAVKRITQIEIDACVIEASKKYLPSMSGGFKNPKANFLVGDGFEFMKKYRNEFDVIITDCSDPIGPSACLYEESYFQLMKKALRPGGIVCIQSGTAWVKLDHVAQTLALGRSTFAVASYCVVSIPTLPTGQIGFVLGSLNPDTDFKEPLRIFTEDQLEEMKMRYYSSEVHRAAFVLPRFIVKALQATENKNDQDN